MKRLIFINENMLKQLESYDLLVFSHCQLLGYYLNDFFPYQVPIPKSIILKLSHRGDSSIQAYEKNKFNKSLSKLEEVGAITISGRNILYNSDCVILDQDHRYAAYDINNIVKLLENNNTKTIKYFITLLMTMRTAVRGKVTFPVNYSYGETSLDSIGKKLGITPQTLSKYNRTLEDLKLIKIFYRPFSKSKNATNIYCKYENRDEVARFLRVNMSVYTNAPNTRSLMMKYTWMCNGKTYSPDEEYEIYKYILKYNETHDIKKSLNCFSNLTKHNK